MRPSYFFPSYPPFRQHTRGLAARVADTTLGPLLKSLGRFTPVEEMGRFAVELAKGRWGEQDQTFSNERMREIFKSMEGLGA